MREYYVFNEHAERREEEKKKKEKEGGGGREGGGGGGGGQMVETKNHGTLGRLLPNTQKSL